MCAIKTRKKRQTKVVEARRRTYARGETEQLKLPVETMPPAQYGSLPKYSTEAR